MTYGEIHRFFLRTVASQGVISIADAQIALERFTEQLSVTDLVSVINDEIQQYYQALKITKDEVTNEDVVVFLSLADDAVLMSVSPEAEKTAPRHPHGLVRSVTDYTCAFPPPKRARVRATLKARDREGIQGEVNIGNSQTTTIRYAVNKTRGCKDMIPI